MEASSSKGNEGQMTGKMEVLHADAATKSVCDGSAEPAETNGPVAGLDGGVEDEIQDPEGRGNAESDRIGGFLWKFPSEGSNLSPGGGYVDDVNMMEKYPRRCRYCDNAWVSSYVNEKRHWRKCNASAASGEDDDVKMKTKLALGTPRRVWCEVDDALTGLQWRDGVRAIQDEVLCRLPFHDIVDVVLLQDPQHSFQVTTAAGRRVVFQWRADDDHTRGNEPRVVKSAEEVLGTKALDAKQWVECLEIFSRFTQEQKRSTCSAIREENEQFEDDSRSEVLSEITRAIASNDIDALKELLDDDGMVAAKALFDDNGSSLLVTAFKLGGDEHVIRALVNAGVDINAQNNDGETPLLLAAASGDCGLVHALLSIDGIDIGQRCAMGATAFHGAANAGEVSILRILCDHRAASPSDVDDNGWTALHYAAACPTGIDATRFLCELIPELIDMQCYQAGNTALHVAAGYGCEENVRALLETAANPYVVNHEDQNAYHVALHNNRIACALVISDYMDTPRDAYERANHSGIANRGPIKEDEVGRAEVTHDVLPGSILHDRATTEATAYAWTEYLTEDHIPYYYNYITGESTWHKPVGLGTEDPQALPPPPPTHAGWESASEDEIDQYQDSTTQGDPTDGQRLPLCMIPLVSPLVSLDDPTAATKFDSRRKKDRERRRSRMQRQRNQRHGAPGNMPPPPPPPAPSSSPSFSISQQSELARYEVQ